jgi:hypothetical protein
MTNELWIISGIWAVAVGLYYFAGKKHGYADGYRAGIAQGHNNVLSALNASSEFLQEQKP